MTDLLTRLESSMRRVTSAEFFAYVGPRDVHPHPETDHVIWEARDRTVVGKSLPGWRNPGDPEAFFLRALDQEPQT